jgi:hypothetical protein
MNYLQLYIYVYVGKVDGISQQLDMSSDNPKEWKEMKVFDYIYMCIFIHIEIYVYISFYMHMCLYIQIQILLVVIYSIVTDVFEPLCKIVCILFFVIYLSKHHHLGCYLGEK